MFQVTAMATTVTPLMTIVYTVALTAALTVALTAFILVELPRALGQQDMLPWPALILMDIMRGVASIVVVL